MCTERNILLAISPASISFSKRLSLAATSSQRTKQRSCHPSPLHHAETLRKRVGDNRKNATYFKEKSFMNHYFAKSRAVLYTITAAELAIWRAGDSDSKSSSAMIYFHGAESHSRMHKMHAFVETYLPWINETTKRLPTAVPARSGGPSDCMYGRWVPRRAVESGDRCLLNYLLHCSSGTVHV